MASCAPGQWGNTPFEWIDPLETMEEYVLELQVTQKSASYIRSARAALIHFTNYCRREGLTHPDQITRNHLLQFQAILNANTSFADSYRTQIMKYIRTYFNWCVDVGHLNTSPFIRIRIVPPPKTPNPLTEDELTLLMKQHRKGAFSMSPFSFHRREMLLAILFAWGLRVHEAEALDVDDFDVNNDFVIARNKGGGTKTLPYTDELKIIFQRYSRVRGSVAKNDEHALFITQTGERMSKEYISKTIADLGSSAGIDINAHMLRDTCGTSLLDADVPVERVAKILGHTNIKQTLAYSEVRDKKVAEDLSRAMNPKLRKFFGRNTGDLRE